MVSVPIHILNMLFSGLFQNKNQNSIRVVSDKTSIYVEPNTTPLNFSAQKGDIFEIQEVQIGWIKINLFSGGDRYIKESKVEIIGEIKLYPSNPSIRGKLCSHINIDLNKASKDAVSKFPNDLEHQATYVKVLMDKYILSTFRNLIFRHLIIQR